ncbi:MAG: family 20 glycosylhydrolase [Chloroflexi bacterium]|nr:family 20 glycosylhydrolase [Chloroflexota bacterium]
MTLHLLPTPKVLSQSAGMFNVDENTLIVISASAGDPVTFAAGQLQDEIWRAEGARVSLLKAFALPRQVNTITLICGAGQAAELGIEPLRPDVPADTPHRAKVEAQAFSVQVTPARVVLYADEPTGLFYAVQLLRQLLRADGRGLPSMTVHDWPTLPYRGVMLDVSRRKVPTLAALKEVVAELSHYRLNALQLYTEHTFAFPSHPEIGRNCGSLTSQDILELDACCRQYHVELMPNLQSFGHARNTLILPEYQHLAESDMLWTLSPAFEGTYELLDDLYADMLPAFSSKTLNIDCDETYDLGHGASKPLADEIGVGRLYLQHILRVRELAARYGCSIQMWGDILLHHPELIEEVPEDVTLLDWHYEPADEYPTTRIFGESGRPFWVCPGTGSWNSIFPRLNGGNRNIRNLVRDGVEAGAEGVLNTDWGDNGHYQPLGLSWYGYVFGAVQGWTGGATDDAEFNAAFGPLFFGSAHEAIMQMTNALASTNDLSGVYRPNRSHTVLALFDEPLTGVTVDGEDALPEDTLARMQLAGGETAATCDSLAPGHWRNLTLRELALAGRQTAYAARKTALSQTIRGALRDPSLAPTDLYGYILALKSLDAELEDLRAEFETLWLARSRRSEIHVALGYYARLRARYEAAIGWLEDQRKALLAGERIDTECESYDADGYRTVWQRPD